MMSNSAHGKNFQKWLLEEFLLLEINGKLKGVTTNYGVRHPGYSSPSQYYAPFIISLNNDTQWAVFTTTTCRTDRIKGQQWDAEHIKQFCPQITRVCLVYPDGVSINDRKAFVAQQNKYENHWEFSCIDKIESVSDLEKEINNVK